MVLVASEPVSEPRLTQLAISYYQKEQSNRIFIRTIRDEWSDWRELSSADQLCNPNLLDNWYFANPVNQRGQTEYTTNYAIDRWWLQNSTSLNVVEGGVNVIGKWDIEQFFEKALPNGTYTLSLLYKDKIGSDPLRLIAANRSSGDVAQILTKDASGIICVTFTSDKCDKIVAGFAGSADNVATFVAAKLELGDTQTLAHKENGVWVLNEIPDYGEQLRRCQRYFVRFPACHGLGGHQIETNVCFRYSLDVPMRTVPSLVLENQTDLTNAIDNGASPATPSVFHVWGTNQADCIAFWFEGAPTPNTCWTCNRYIDASADL